MITSTTTPLENQSGPPAVQSKNGWPLLWQRLALAGVMLISIFMNFYQLGRTALAICTTPPRSEACSTIGEISSLSPLIPVVL